MKAKEIRKKPQGERMKILKEKIKRLQDIRFAGAEAKSKNTKEATNLRKDIARIKAILKESEEEK